MSLERNAASEHGGRPPSNRAPQSTASNMHALNDFVRNFAGYGHLDVAELEALFGRVA